MKKRFVVALDSHTDAQDLKFKEYVNNASLGWWYWIDGFWLLVDHDSALTATQLRKDLESIYSGVTLFVLEISGNDHTWSGFGPNAPEKDMFKWLRETWAD